MVRLHRDIVLLLAAAMVALSAGTAVASYHGGDDEPEGPTAVIDATCSHLDCRFSGSDSEPGDAPIEAHDWDTGDGTHLKGEAVEHVYDEPGTYTITLTVTDENDKADTATENVTVDAPPLQAAFTSECRQLDCIFDASPSEPSDRLTSYEWQMGDGSNGTGRLANHSYAAPGTYTVTLTVTDEDGDTDQQTDDVTVRHAEDPRAAFTYECDGSECTFDASPSEQGGASIAAYAWELGDGSTAEGETIEHTYPEAGSYVVTLTVTDEDGRSDTRERVIAAENEPPGTDEEDDPEQAPQDTPLSFGILVVALVIAAHADKEHR